MANTILVKKGAGVPSPESLQEAELALDVVDGSLYSKLGDGEIHRLNDSSDSGGGGTGSSVHIGDTPPDSPSEGQQWMEVPASGDATMWIYDSGNGGQWLQHPSGKDGAPGADGNIADGATDGSQDGVIATWDSTAGQWTPEGTIRVTNYGEAQVRNDTGTARLVLADQTNGFCSVEMSATSSGTNRGDLTLSTREGNSGLLPRLTIDSTGDATFSGTARFETLDNPLMLRSGEDFYSIGVGLRDITGGQASCVVYDTWQTHYFEQGDPAHTREVIYCDGNATFSGSVNAGRLVTKSSSTNGAGLLGVAGNDGSQALVPTDLNGDAVDASINLGRTSPTSQLRFKNGYFANQVITRSGVSIGTRDLIETLATLRNATKDETTIKGLRDAIGNAVGGLIEKFEAMQSTATQEISDE